MKRITMIGLRSKTELMMSNGEPSERDLEKNHNDWAHEERHLNSY
ncbi:hypothetical protein [Enterococcus gallinarum]|nr:hypothetical protein [Enterococcus gallinarum]